MEENKKEYSVIGTVTIGTDEYRDLLEDKFTAEKEKSEWHAKWYNEYCAKGKLESECKKLKEELDRVKNFIKKNSVHIGEDGVSMSVIMSLFGDGEE
ncbi:hypothetical protein J6O48_02925 [bacterium]|nr:hypothetical protein [bacterium]